LRVKQAAFSGCTWRVVYASPDIYKCTSFFCIFDNLHSTYSATTRSSGTDRTQVDHDVSSDAGDFSSMLQRSYADQEQQQDCEKPSPHLWVGLVTESARVIDRGGFVVPHSPTAAHVPKGHFHLLIRPSSHLTFLTITSSGRESVISASEFLSSIAIDASVS